MKTKLSDRKLKLQRETLRELNPETLGQAWGGEVYQTVVRPTVECDDVRHGSPQPVGSIGRCGSML